MKTKILILISLMFILCGCTSEYNLRIDKDNNYYESFTLQEESNDGINKDYYKSIYLEEYPIFYSQEFMYYNPTEKIEGNTYYDKSISEENGLLKTVYKGTFDNDSYKDSRVLKSSFKKRNIGYNSKNAYYYLELEDLIIFKEENKLSKINVNITLDDDLIMLKNNATSVNGNVYSWSFTDKKAKIIFSYQTKSDYEDIQNSKYEEKLEIENPYPEKKQSNTESLLIVLLGLLGFFITLIIIVKVKKKSKK